MKRSIYLLPLLAITVFACQPKTKTGTSADTTASTADTSMMPATDNEGADFVMKAADGGMMEVELGKMAQQQAQSARVKKFGAMMVSDHSKANDELKSIAASKNITLSDSLSEKHRKDVDDLREKKGTDFDKAYMKLMVDDHKKDVDEFEDASKEQKDADIKAFAGKTLPVLQMHLDSAKAINDVLK